MILTEKSRLLDHHHRALLEALIGRMREEKFPGADELQVFVHTWATHSPQSKREILRQMVSDLRQFRVNTRRVVASALRLGPDGVQEIWSLSPQAALERAKLHLGQYADAKNTFEALNSLALPTSLRKAAETSSSEETIALQKTLEGHKQLVEALQEDMVSALSLMMACLPRAGGHILSHTERVQLRKAFEEIDKVRANLAKPE